MTDSRGTSEVDDAAIGRSAGELAHHASVGARHLDQAVRTIDESLFMVFADADVSRGSETAFAPEAMADLAALLERTALEVDAVATRLGLLGARADRAHAAPAVD